MLKKLLTIIGYLPKREITQPKKLIYLASPYTHSDKNIQIERFNKIIEVAAFLLNNRNYVYSPIAHCHPISVNHNLPGDWQYWKEFAEIMINRCDAFYICTMNGWDSSVGVQAETHLAKALDIPVSYICPETYKITVLNYE